MFFSEVEMRGGGREGEGGKSREREGEGGREGETTYIGSLSFSIYT